MGNRVNKKLIGSRKAVGMMIGLTGDDYTRLYA